MATLLSNGHTGSAGSCSKGEESRQCLAENAQIFRSCEHFGGAAQNERDTLSRKAPARRTRQRHPVHSRRGTFLPLDRRSRERSSEAVERPTPQHGRPCACDPKRTWAAWRGAWGKAKRASELRS